MQTRSVSFKIETIFFKILFSCISYSKELSQWISIIAVWLLIIFPAIVLCYVDTRKFTKCAYCTEHLLILLYSKCIKSILNRSVDGVLQLRLLGFLWELLGFGHCPSSCILKKNQSLVQWLRLTLSNGANTAGVSRPLIWGLKQIQFPIRCVLQCSLGFPTMDEVQNPSNP
jgi:hypothetical protein